MEDHEGEKGGEEEGGEGVEGIHEKILKETWDRGFGSSEREFASTVGCSVYIDTPLK